MDFAGKNCVNWINAHDLKGSDWQDKEIKNLHLALTLANVCSFATSSQLDRVNIEIAGIPYKG